MNNNNIKKAEQLGMPTGTASAILRKKILFSFVQKLGLDTCYRCNKKIEKEEELSIEHIIPWLDSENPKDLFFDLSNISFSHLKCNSGSVRKEYLIKNGKQWGSNNIVSCPNGASRCGKCKKIKVIEDFNKNKNRYRGVEPVCKECRKEIRKMRR